MLCGGGIGRNGTCSSSCRIWVTPDPAHDCRERRPLSTVFGNDRVLVIKQGHAESGTHEELLEKSVSYADLYRRQFREPAPTAPG